MILLFDLADFVNFGRISSSSARFGSALNLKYRRLIPILPESKAFSLPLFSLHALSAAFPNQIRRAFGK